MKLTPELAKASAKMKAGALSRDGFFGGDLRDLPTLLEEQQGRCAHLGVAPADIAAAMRRIGRAGLAGFGGPVTVEDKWEVIADENRGKIPCPWPHPGVYQKTVYQVRHLATGKTIQYSELSIHLIERHGFFQGHGAPFFNDPAELIAVLELVPADDLPVVENLAKA